MKKVLAFLVVIGFIVFAVLGFKAASSLMRNGMEKESPGSSSALKDTQQNYFLIHVTDLESDDSQLISVWGMFTFFSSPPQVMFIPLFPAYDDKVQSSLLSSFKITSQSSVSSRFITQLEEEFQFKASGYVLIDNSGLSLVRKWIMDDDSQVSARTPQSADEKKIILYNGQQFFKSICKQVGAQGIGTVLDRIQWLEILPSHFSTDLSFESATLAMEQLKATNSIQLCEVLSNE